MRQINVEIATARLEARKSPRREDTRKGAFGAHS